jgi:selenide, water dikinase
MQGRIACCNVLSDLYAMGVPRVDHMLMVLGVSLEMPEVAREITTREMIRGFNDCATDAGTKITGGQSIMNPWPIIGGIANVMLQEDEFIRPNNGQPGDVIILTKPLGT